jgi:excisionase family DNA binding protein
MELQTIKEEPAFLTPMQCAARLQLSRCTIYRWISDGKLDRAQGLSRIGGRRLIECKALKVAIERGDFA